MSSFKELLQLSFKSEDTEEWIDIYFTRPIGLVFALMWNRMGIHPNAITILSIFLGVASAFMFSFTDLAHNIAGILLLMFANFCDSTDGQMARITGKKTLLGRVLDGFSGDVWFFAIYVALSYRMTGQLIPGTNMVWGIWIWIIALIAGILCHSPQSSLSDYYRQIHLYFLKGKSGSELDNYKQQRDILQRLDKGQWFARLYHYNYANYCKSQERRTPKFQKFFTKFNNLYPNVEQAPSALKNLFLEGSRPLMKYTNILTFNIRAICIYTTCLLGCPWLYLIVEITLFNCLYIYMHKRHEALCAHILEEMK